LDYGSNDEEPEAEAVEEAEVETETCSTDEDC